MEDSKKKPKSKNPCVNSNILSYGIYRWTSEIFSIGQKRSLEYSDCYEPLKEHSSSYLSKKLDNIWQKKVKEGSPNLILVLLQVFWKQITINLITLLISELFFKVVQPLLLGKLISYYSPGKSDMTSNDLYLYTLGFIICSMLALVLRHPFSFSNGHIGMKVRVACCALIYKKSLKISKTDSIHNSTGQIVNLLAKDVSAFDYSTLLLLYLITAPIQAIIMTVFMYQRMGVSVLIGNLCLLIVIPFQIFLGKIIKNKKQKSMPLTDTRLNFVNEVIAGINVIKMFAWEKPFTKLMKSLRRKEIDKIKYLSWTRALVMSFVVYNTRFALFMSIIVYVFLGNTISAENVFVVICYYDYIKHALCNIFPIAITNIAELKVALKRIQSFLLQKELETTSIMLDNLDNENETEENDDDETIIPFIGNDKIKQFKIRWNPVVESIDPIENNEDDVDEDDKVEGSEEICYSNKISDSLKSTNSDYALKLENVYMKWNSNQYEHNLSNISLEIKRGSLVAIIGQVGCGKSSFFHTILKETPVSSGILTIDGSISYASQDPWLFNNSVRQNILFGSEMNQCRYNDVIRNCILEKDIKSFTNGDDTIVGEKGMKISGGQQARINLARAVYRNADIFLFDDPLSAVDCHVGQQLFSDCIVEFLKGKTRLLITHQYQYLPKVDHIILLDNGYLIAEGSYESLLENCSAFQNLINSKEDNLDELCTEMKTEDNSYETEEYDLMEDKISDEQQKEGSVKRWVYKSYIAASGPAILFIAFLIVFLFGQVLASYSDYWITLWVVAEENAFTLYKNMTNFINITSDFNGENSTNLEENNKTISSDNCLDFYYMVERHYFINVYSALIVFLVFFAIFRVIMFFWLCLKASVKLHNDLFKAVIHATMRFFYTTPTGRILNRFIYDMSMVDEILPKIIYDCIQIFSQVLGIMVLIVYINFWLLIPIMISVGFFIYLRHYYTNVARSLKRLEASARSPVFSHLNASFRGLSTIRAFGVQKILEKEFNEHQDLHSSVWFMNLGTSRAFGLWLDAVCMAFLIIVVLILVIAGRETAGNIGLGITQALGIIGIFQYAIRTLTEVETLMTSVERILEYQDVEQEPPLHMELDKKLPEDWPLEGKIEFENVSSRYSPNGKVILKRLSFVCQSREKIGIVGRSGSGKTSIINTIFRMLFTDGVIKIDEININSIGLHKLRHNISVIPQEPVLFSGTLRYNLDPFSSCDDDTLWTALERVELKDIVSSLNDGLDTEITGENSSFSVGQRQLICLARALLCKNCILILDEATANVDPRTDSLIQKTIREEFKHYTVITIAHRLQTIMDSDKVMVMENSKKIEFDHPYILLQNKEGKFSNMVRVTEDGGESLYEVAKKSYMEKHQQQIFNEG